MAINIGRLCVKIAGRDAGKKCVVVDLLDKNFVLVDGQTRRKKCNILHLEPLAQTLDIKKGASHEDVKAEFKELKIVIKDKKPKEKPDSEKSAEPAKKPKKKIPEKKSKKGK